MTRNRRLAILAQSATPEGVVVGYRGLTHHEAATTLEGLIARKSKIHRYHLTDEGQRYLAVMDEGAA